MVTFGVVKGTTVYASTGKKFQLPRTFDRVGDLLDGAVRHGINQLWCYDAPSITTWASSQERGEWDIEAPCAAPWVHCYRNGSNDEVELVYPSLAHRSPWSEAKSAPELLNALQLYARLVGQPWCRSSGAMSFRLLRSRQQRHPNCTPIELQEELPPPATMTGIEGPAHWIRRLTDSERSMGWIHSYDKNGAYLGACADLDIGSGAVRYVKPGRNAFLTNDDLKAAGYFLVDDVIGPSTIPAMYLSGRPGPQWVAAPTLKLLLELGMPATCVREAYLFEHKHLLLKGWYELLRDARMKLVEDTTPGAKLALAAVKDTYGAFNGWIASRGASRKEWDRTGDALYRPDVRHAMESTARCNLVRKAYKCINNDGVIPLALGGVDGLYIVSDDPDPIQAAPASITFGTTLKDFKPNPSLPLSAFLDVLDSDLAVQKRLSTIVNAVNSMKKRGAA